MNKIVTKKCYTCKQLFREDQLTGYCSPKAKTPHNYCINCLQEKIARDKFSDQICIIFGVKAPGPRIWTERKRLKDKYGYTDDIILDCLDYIYNVKKKYKKAESLCLVTPIMVEEMLRYKKHKLNEVNHIAQAMATEMKDYVAPVKENNNKKTKEWDPDEWLED